MKEKMVKLYISNDGEEHKSAAACIRHEANCAFTLWYDNCLNCNLFARDSVVESDDLFIWLRVNKEQVLKVINLE